MVLRAPDGVPGVSGRSLGRTPHKTKKSTSLGDSLSIANLPSAQGKESMHCECPSDQTHASKTILCCFLPWLVILRGTEKSNSIFFAKWESCH